MWAQQSQSYIEIQTLHLSLRKPRRHLRPFLKPSLTLRRKHPFRFPRALRRHLNRIRPLNMGPARFLIAGIGIGAGVIALFIATMAFWWFWRRRRNKPDNPGITETPSRKQQYLCNISTSGAKQPYELHSDSRYVYPLELDNTQARASKYMAEMPG
ncbi:uncharacterized protein TRUGW13939_01323 [Talaromyces rugulosus]|uniref:Uncharacterized protein n=1 Tax=Talaromyces rugulosus TaxID=121627 RepID=A0A7H8QJX6_TALRU|nr:uncharacterized protein TRUGW13939_01323 [Talaromyces rugulosus]QKX54238.1 hypothetical protein TRUGW13939_01323 [Talaromyces rugulosus]